MKEYPLTIKDFKGLRPHSRLPRNAPNYAEECYNMRVGKFGLEPYEGIIQPFTGLPTATHPLPQLLDTKDGMFIGTGTTIYNVNSDNSLTVLLSGLSGAAKWHLADFGLYQLYANGTYLVQRDDARLFSIKAMPFTVGSVCNFRGQLIMGNLGGDFHNFVAWSNIGRLGDITKILQDESNKNTSGFMPMLGGSVLCVKELEECVIVYCTDCVVALIPVTSPTVTYGRKIISHTGIYSRDAVDGDIHAHVYVDKNKRINRISSGKLANEMLWYDEYISTLGTSLSVSYDDADDTFYISDGLKGYMLSAYGLTSIMDYATSITRVNGVLTGIRTRSTDVSAYMTTTMIDFGIRGIKTIMGIQISGEGTALTAGVGYRYTSSGAFTSAVMKPASIEGMVTPIVAGTDLKIKIASTSYITFKLDEIEVRWKLTDKRGIRGIYGTSGKNA